jgi:hypothetical protein
VAESSALRTAVKAFIDDRDVRLDALEVRRNLVKAIVSAHSEGVSDQQLADAFQRAEQDRKLALSRTRIQQLRTGDK